MAHESCCSTPVPGFITSNEKAGQVFTLNIKVFSVNNPISQRDAVALFCCPLQYHINDMTQQSTISFRLTNESTCDQLAHHHHHHHQSIHGR